LVQTIFAGKFMKNFFLLKGKQTILREKSKWVQYGQGAEDVEKLQF
jgi:hypothetical protein